MNNWFEKYAEARQLALILAVHEGLDKEAGAKESMISAILGAIIAILGGMPAESAARQLQDSPRATQVAESMVSLPVARERIQSLGPGALEAAESLSRQLKHQDATDSLPNPFSFSQEEQVNIIARTIWAMARSRSDAGMRAVATSIWNSGNGQPETMIASIMRPRQYSCWGSMTPSDWNNFSIKEKSGKEWEMSVSLAKAMVEGSFMPTVGRDDAKSIAFGNEMPKTEYLKELRRSLQTQGKLKGLSDKEIEDMLEMQYILIHQKEPSPDEKAVIKERATNLDALKDRYEKQSSLANDMPIIEQVAKEQGLNELQKKMLVSVRVIENGRRGCEFGMADYDLASPARRYSPERVGIDKSKPGWEKEWDAKYRDLSLKVQAEYAAGTIKKRLQFDENGNPLLARFAFRWCPEKWQNWTGLIKKFMMS